MTDAERFDEIYREYRHKVLGYIRSHVSDPEDAEDLCSEVFRKAWEHLDPEDGKGVSSYLYTISRNTVVDYYRTRRIHTPLTEDLPAENSMEETVLNRDALDRLAQALRQLPPRERDVVVLHYYANNSLQEISDKMKLPYSVIKRAHQSSLKKLRGMLGNA